LPTATPRPNPSAPSPYTPDTPQPTPASRRYARNTCPPPAPPWLSFPPQPHPPHSSAAPPPSDICTPASPDPSPPGPPRSSAAHCDEGESRFGLLMMPAKVAHSTSDISRAGLSK